MAPQLAGAEQRSPAAIKKIHFSSQPMAMQFRRLFEDERTKEAAIAEIEKRVILLKVPYPDIHTARLYLDWNIPHTIHEADAHLDIVHLHPQTLFEWGAPLYDLAIRTMIGDKDGILRFKDRILSTLERESFSDPLTQTASIISFVYCSSLMRILRFIDNIIPGAVDW